MQATETNGFLNKKLTADQNSTSITFEQLQKILKVQQICFAVQQEETLSKNVSLPFCKRNKTMSLESQVQQNQEFRHLP